MKFKPSAFLCIRMATLQVSKFRFEEPTLGDPVRRPVQTKPGFVLTTHKEYGLTCVECIESLLPHLDGFRESVVAMYLNEPTPETERVVRAALAKAPASCRVHVVVVENQVANAILTGTWNQGTNFCLEQGCDAVLVTNHDIVFNRSVHHFVQAVVRPDVLGIVGPLMLCPHRMPWQDVGMGKVRSSVGKTPDDRTEMLMVRQEAGGSVFGGFFAMNRQTLEVLARGGGASPTNTPRDYTLYFDENYPTGENEIELANRWDRTFRVQDASGDVATPNWIVTSAMFQHGAMGTWTNQVDKYVDRFAQSKDAMNGLQSAVNANDPARIDAAIETFLRHARSAASGTGTDGDDSSSSAAASVTPGVIIWIVLGSLAVLLLVAWTTVPALRRRRAIRGAPAVRARPRRVGP